MCHASRAHFTLAGILAIFENAILSLSNCLSSKDIVDFSDVLKLTKEKKELRMTLVSTGVKCQLEKDTYLDGLLEIYNEFLKYEYNFYLDNINKLLK